MTGKDLGNLAKRDIGIQQLQSVMLTIYSYLMSHFMTMILSNLDTGHNYSPFPHPRLYCQQRNPDWKVSTVEGIRRFKYKSLVGFAKEA